MGTVISAITGSENPSEVAKMAEQAEEVKNFQKSKRSLLQIIFNKI